MEYYPIEGYTVSAATECIDTDEFFFNDFLDVETKALFGLIGLTPLESFDDKVDLIIHFPFSSDTLFTMKEGRALEWFEINLIVDAILADPIISWPLEGFITFTSLEYVGYEVHISSRLCQQIFNRS